MNDPTFHKPRTYDLRDVNDISKLLFKDKKLFHDELRKRDDWVEKLRNYNSIVDSLVDDVYNLLIPEIKKLYQC
ncbi:MAG: hypothetical protein ACTSWY_03090 [Promethearchaeota archaeon]